MHPHSAAVKRFLATAPPERARPLGAWFAAFPTELQDVLLERQKRHAGVAVVFGEETHSLGRITA